MAVENRLLSYHGALLRTVVVMLVIFAGATLFATEQETQAQGNLPSTPPTADGIQFAQISVLDGDIDNDGNQDGVADPLALLAPIVVASLGALLLALREPPKLSADWVLVLERPG